jgi:hypothetical protein
VESVLRVDHDSAPENRPLTPRARQVFQHAVVAAERQGLPLAGTGHVLLGLLEDSDGVAYHVLRELGAVPPDQGLAQVAGLVAAETRAGADAEGPEEPLPELAPEILRALEAGGKQTSADAGPLAAEVRMPPQATKIRRDLDAEDQAGVLLLGAARGALRGLSWSLIAAVVVLLLLWRPPAQGGPERALSVAGLTLLVWVFVSAVAGALRTREQMLADEYEAMVRTQTWQAISWTTLVLAPVALFLLSVTWDRRPAAAVFTAAAVLVVGVIVAAMVGYARGTKAALAATHEARAKLGHWDASTLAQRRTELQHAVETRFGPLGEAARDRLQRWEQDRLVEADGKLAEAQSLGELDLED